MKKVYWRPRTLSRTGLALIAIVSVVGLLMVEQFKVERRRPYYAEKMKAAHLAQQAMDAIKETRIRQGPPIDASTDPAESGLIGLPMSEVTSVSGVLPAKQTSINPNFAAVLVDMLKQAGVQKGDVVALGVSGSFPALNLCAYAAIETLELEPIVIASASASQWGANVPDLLWIDMERLLAKEGVFKARAIAASLGGHDDCGLGLSEEGRLLVRSTIERNELDLIEVPDFDANVLARLKRYRKASAGRPIKVYVNIGGGLVSVGKSTGKKLFNPGLNRTPPDRIALINGVMPQMIAQGIPCIHLVRIVDLAERYGLEIAPPEAPEVGQAGVFSGIDYNRTLVVAALAAILLSLWGFIRSDVGFRLLRGTSGQKRDGPPEPMV